MAQGRSSGAMLKRVLQVLKQRLPRLHGDDDAAASARRVEEALEHYRSGDATAAGALCRAALALDRRQARAWSLLARIALDDNRLERALECYAPILAAIRMTRSIWSMRARFTAAPDSLRAPRN
jgi:Tfp pilus assembly protein PilF